MTRADEPASDRAAIGQPASPTIRRVSSEALMCGQRLLLIRHGNDDYRLQITQGGKLILTK